MIHTDPALRNRQHMTKAPYMDTHRLFLAKVTAVHPANGTVDVAIDGANGQGGFYANIPVMSWSYGSMTGQTYMPTIKLSVPIPTKEGTYDQPVTSGEQDIWCVCGHLNGRTQRAVCLGFLSPLTSQVHTQSVGMDVKVHESGVYQLITTDGSVELVLPDGSSILVSQGTTLHDMSSENSAWAPKTSSTPYTLTLTIKGNVTLNINGSATVNAPSVYLGTATGGGKGVARIGDTVNLSTGVIETGSTTTFSG